jgi:uncharacterized protein
MYRRRCKDSKKLKIVKSRIRGGGYGVIATHPIRAGEVLEVCPFIEIPKHIVFDREPNMLQNYVFTSHCKPNHALVVFGYGSMYNHSLKNPNVYYRINTYDKNRLLDFVALKDVPPGAELLVSYGPGHQVNH